MHVPPSTDERNSSAPPRLVYEVLERRLRELGVADDDTSRGEFLEVTRHTVMRWRRGHTGVSLSVAMRVAQRIGVDLMHLLSDSPQPGTPPPSPPPPQPPRQPTHPPARSEESR